MAKGLTKRMLEILRQVAQDKTDKQIAENLGIKHGTVRTYLKSSFYRLGAGNREQAVQFAKNKGLI